MMDEDKQAGSAEHAGLAYASVRHELAERLQSTGNYLRAARRLLADEDCVRVPEIMDKAIEQLGHAEVVFHRLNRDRPLRETPAAVTADASRRPGYPVGGE